MRRLIAMGLVLGACGGDSGPTGPITARITNYDYTFDIDSREAHAKVTADVEVGGDCFTLPFRGDALIADTLSINGAPMRTASVAGGNITMCGSGYEAGTEITFETDHEIPLETLSTSQVGYSITNDAAGNPFYYLVSWVGGCDRFAPCDNRPDQFATYTFHVTHPAGFTARCPGTITEVSATETQCDFALEGGPTYSTFGVAVYPAWEQAARGMWGSAAVTLYDRPETGVAAKIDDAHHGGFVAFMEEHFGPYPYGNELRILTAPTYWGGFEHPGNIVLNDRLPSVGGTNNHANPLRETIDHEIAHMWAGDQTTLAGTYDFVWKEAMAEYLPYVYLDTVNTLDAAKTPIAWKVSAQRSTFFLVPGEEPELFDYYGDVYSPGPMILFRQLEVLSSRDQVLAGIADALSNRTLSVDQLVASLETATGLDLQDYAAAWIRGSGSPAWPEVTLTFTPGGETSTLRVLQTLALERRCKFRVALLGASQERQDVEVDTFRNGTDQTISVPTPAFTVTETVLDPARECLVYATGASSKPVPSGGHHPWVDSGHLAPAIQ